MPVAKAADEATMVPVAKPLSETKLGVTNGWLTNDGDELMIVPVAKPLSEIKLDASIVPVAKQPLGSKLDGTDDAVAFAGK